MVGFVRNSSVNKEEEKRVESIEHQSSVENKNNLDDSFCFSLPDIYDFSSPFTDSFVDFDPIKEWLEEDPPIGPPPYSMDDNGEDMSYYLTVDKSNEMGIKEICEKASDEEVCYANDEDVKVETTGFLEQEKSNEMKVGNCCEEVVVEEYSPTDEGVKAGSLVDFVLESDDLGAVEKFIEKGCDELVEKIETKVGTSGDVGFSIEEELRRVSLNPELNDSDMAGVLRGKIKNGGVVGEEAGVAITDSIDDGIEQSAEILNVDVNGGGKKEVQSCKDYSRSESQSESESDSSGSSSSDTSSDDDDDDDKDEKEETPKRKTNISGGGETELEEGEIMAFQGEEMVSWSDEEEDDDDDPGGNAMKGPIRSKNEIADLPPVPSVKVSLLPHHRTLPVGIISSIMGHRVIVEGVERHNPLSEGSIVWITESRSPLGLVDEIFGPVKNPYYIVRYNSETDVPAGLQKGTQISFVPEFADYVLNNANLYRKGYDASGENDEELSEEAEFSDDEKEAEYRRMQKMKKRGTNDDNGENRKKDKRNSKNRFGAGKHEQSTAKQTQHVANDVSTQHFVQPFLLSSGTRPIFFSGLEPQLGMAPGSSATTSSNMWLNRNLSQPTAGTGFPINPQMQGMPWLQGNHPPPVVQEPFLNGTPFQQNIQMNPSWPSNLATGAGQSNFGPGPAFAPWPGGVSPNFLNQTLFGVGMQFHNASTQTNIGAFSSSGLQHGYNSQNTQNFLNQSILRMGMQGHDASTLTYAGENTATISNGFQLLAKPNPGQDTFQNFNHGTNRGGGRKSYHRGGLFGGWRGRGPS